MEEWDGPGAEKLKIVDFRQSEGSDVLPF
jgi:hypothetical protein